MQTYTELDQQKILTTINHVLTEDTRLVLLGFGKRENVHLPQNKFDGFAIHMGAMSGFKCTPAADKFTGSVCRIVYFAEKGKEPPHHRFGIPGFITITHCSNEKLVNRPITL